MEQQTGSKQGKEYIKAVYCHPACLTYIQSTSQENAGVDEAQIELKYPNISTLDEISITSDMQMTLPLQGKVKN